MVPPLGVIYRECQHGRYHPCALAAAASHGQIPSAAATTGNDKGLERRRTGEVRCFYLFSDEKSGILPVMLQRQDFLRSLPSFCFTSLLLLYYFSHHFFSPSGSCTNLCFLDFPNSCLFGDIFLSHDQLSRWVVFIFLLILFLSASVRLLNRNRYLLKTLNPKLGFLHARFLYIGHSSPTIIFSEGVN